MSICTCLPMCEHVFQSIHTFGTFAEIRGQLSWVDSCVPLCILETKLRYQAFMGTFFTCWDRLHILSIFLFFLCVWECIHHVCTCEGLGDTIHNFISCTPIPLILPFSYTCPPPLQPPPNRKQSLLWKLQYVTVSPTVYPLSTLLADVRCNDSLVCLEPYRWWSRAHLLKGLLDY